MKFEYKDTEETKEGKAHLFRFDLFDDEYWLAVVTDSDKVVWFYEGGGVLISEQNSLNLNSPDLVKTFYEGDTITITF
jgi:hypothetical protein